MSDPFDSGSTVKDDLGTALTDVRRAYRLLWAFHRRQLDMLGEIDQSFRSLGLHFESWKPAETSRPSRGAPFAPGKWAWDLLPGNRMWFLWRGSRRRRDVVASVWTYADDVWEWPGREPDPALWKTSPEQSASVLWLELIEGPRGASDEDFKAVAALLEERDLFGPIDLRWDDRDWRSFTLKLDLRELPDQPALWDKVLRPVTEWWSGDGS